MRYKEITEEIKKKLDIVDIIREYLPGLKKAGRNYKTLCPFHGEKTPSFSVNQDKQIFYCFGCGEGGDMFSFVMKIENITFFEAMKKLAPRAGIQMENVDINTLSPADREKIALKKTMETASFHYQKLFKSAAAKKAADYLKGRNIKDETVRNFGIGFAPDSDSLIIPELEKTGFHKNLILKAGLANVKENGRVTDYFRNRIIFPIKNTNGDVIAFGGRIVEDGMPKYLNSPETPLFSKRKTLFGLFESLPRIRKDKKILIVEGYMDVVTLHQFGVNFAVSPLGTSLTPEHAQTIKRYCDEALLLFDPDAAGINAAVKAADILVENGVYPRIGLLRQGLDPDEFLIKEGIEAFYDLLTSATDAIDFKIRLILEKKTEIKAMEKSRIISYLASTLQKQGDEIIRNEWIKKISENFKLSEESIMNRMRKNPAGAKEPGPRQEKQAEAAPPLELGLIHMLLKDPALVRGIPGFRHEMLQSEFSKLLFAEIRDGGDADKEHLTTSLCEKFPQYSRNILKISMEELDSDIDPGLNVKRTAQMIELSYNEKKWKQLKSRISQLDAQELKEFAELTKTIKTRSKGD